MVSILLVSIVAGVGLGPARIGMGDTLAVVKSHLMGTDAHSSGINPGTDTIIWGLRMPRVLMGALVGAGLSAVGVVIQAILRNPLADPYIIGVSSGAALGAVAMIVFGAGLLGAFGGPVAAFVGASVAFTLVFVFAWRDGALNPLRMILAGVAIAALFSSLTSFLVLYAGDEKVRGALRWTMGGLTASRWGQLWIVTPVVLLSLSWFLLQGRTLNAIACGEETAFALGINVNRFRLNAISACALVTGVLVAMSGPIGFVALIMPHMVRLVVGGDHRKVLPISAVAGVCFLVWVDVAARMLIQPTELPIGVITAAIGAPVFLALLPYQARRAAR